MRFTIGNSRDESPDERHLGTGISTLRISDFSRSRKIGHFKSRNSEGIAAVDLRKDACCAIIQFGDLGTGIRGGESPENRHPDIGTSVIGISGVSKTRDREFQ
jgi:hypothetical protein